MGETAKERAGGAQDAIRRAVLRLAARKPLHKISVTEICREAPVHRSTFYKYYGSPYDVMGEIRRLLVAHTAESVMHSLQAGANMHDALCNALEEAAAGPVVTHASVTARPFFARRGYRVLRAQQVECRGVTLANYVMEKAQTGDL